MLRRVMNPHTAEAALSEGSGSGALPRAQPEAQPTLEEALRRAYPWVEGRGLWAWEAVRLALRRTPLLHGACSQAHFARLVVEAGLAPDARRLRSLMSHWAAGERWTQTVLQTIGVSAIR